MFFQYLGDKPLNVTPPGKTYTHTIQPSSSGQKTTDETLYNWLFSPENLDTLLFKKVDGYEVPVQASKPPEDQEFTKPAIKKALKKEID